MPSEAMTTVLADTPGDLNLEVSGSRTPPSNPDAVNKPLDSTQQGKYCTADSK